MSSIDLTPAQRTMLTALVNLYRELEDTVKGEMVAEEIDRSPGTVRNQMQSLKALQLVEGVPGPKGGYKPTASAYEALGVEQMDQPAEVPVHRNGEKVEHANIEEIDFTNVHHPDRCRAEIHIRGSPPDFHQSDEIVIGPTPLSKLVVHGTVDGTAQSNDVVILRITDMEAPAEKTEY